MRLPVQVQVIVFRTTRNGREFLVLHRIPEKGNFWQAITGGLESDDTLMQAAVRELKEETGITEYMKIIENVHFFQFSVDWYKEGETTVLSEFAFGIEVKPNQEIMIDHNVYPEHDEYRWCSLDDACALFKYESSRHALKKLSKMLDEGK